MSDLAEGDLAPDFTLPAAGWPGGEELTLSGLRGQAVVLFFFPKAMTSG